MPIAKCPPQKSPKDIVIRTEIDISAPMTTVFDITTDFEMFAELESMVQSVTITSTIKHGVGVKSHWVIEDPATKERYESDEEIIHYDRPRQYAYHVKTGQKEYQGVYNLSENPDGSTHIFYCTSFYFDVDRGEYRKVIEDMLLNIKKYSENPPKKTLHKKEMK